MYRPHTIPGGSRGVWRIVHAAWPFAAAALALKAFTAIGDNFLGSYLLDLGSLTIPNTRHTQFLFWWTLLGTAAAFFVVLGASRVLAHFPAVGALGASTRRPGDRSWVALISVASFVIAVGIRALILRGTALTDDESAYRFMAEVLASGRLWVQSHPMKTFFDRVFMINDGRFYGQYFIGWSALMVPGVYIGATGYINALYSALTVPALFGIVRRLAGPGAARISTLLFLASPMLMVGSATEMSHPSCMMALAWSFYFHLRSGERPAAWWPHSGVAFFFGLAFLIRPTTALGIGVPVLVAWLWSLRRAPAAVKARALLAFGTPAIALAAVFFGVNIAQNGSPLATSYARMQAYMREVNYQNVGWSPAFPPATLSDYMLPNRHVARAFASSTIAIVRLGYDLFATPFALLLLVFAWAARPARLAWVSFLCFVAVHFFTNEAGVDTFGPVHYYELSLPLLILCGIGYARLVETLHDWRPAMPAAWPMTLVASVVLVSLVGFTPVRFTGVKRIASFINMPFDAVRDARISNAIVFTIGGYWVPQKCSAPTRHFVYFRPNNDLALKNDILWLNHLGWEEDRELLRQFPGRAGYLLNWNGCRIELKRM
jgi:hypothetical protein